MKKLLLWMMVCLFFVGLPVYASNVTDSHGETLTSAGNNIHGWGLNFTANSDLVVYSIGKHPLDTATRCLAFNKTDQQVGSGTFSGNLCSFGSGFSVSNGDFFGIITDNSGGARTLYQKVSVTFPYSLTNVDITSGYWMLNSVAPSITSSNAIYGITNITTDVSGVDVVFNPPTPASGVTNNSQVVINVSCSTPSFNVTLWFSNESNPSTLVIDNQPPPSSYLTNVTLQTTYYYKASCDEGLSNSSVRTWTYDISSPVVVTTLVNNSKLFNKNLYGLFNFTDNIQLNSVNFSIDGVTVFSNESIGQSSFNYILDYNVSSLSAGDHNLSVRVADTHTAVELREEYGVSNGLFNDYLRYDFPKSKYVETSIKGGSVFDSWSSIKKRDRYSQVVVPNSPATSITLIETSNTPIQIINHKDKYKGQWIIIGDHWKDYVLKDEPNSKVRITRISPYSVEVTISGIQNPDRLEFESVGDLNIVTQTYSFSVMNVTETYDSFIYNGVPTSYVLDFYGDFLPLPQVYLFINGSNRSVGLEFQNVNQARFSTSLTFNEVFSGSMSVSHNWFFNSSGLPYDFTSNQTQTLVDVDVGVCQGNISYPIVNMSYFDEVTKEPLLSDNVFNLDFYDGSSTYSVNGTFSNATSNLICSNIDPANSTYYWRMSGTILSLSSPGYATRLFEFDPSVPFNVSNNPEYYLPLYLIRLNESSTVSYTWQTTGFQPISGVMRIYECLSNSSPLLIESTPVVNGLASANIELLNTPYSYDIIIDGQVYTNLQSYTKCHLESSESVQYFVNIDQSNIEDKIGLYGVTCDLTQTGNHTVKLAWSSNPENTEDAITGCIESYRVGLRGLERVYQNCTSSAFSIERTIANTSFDYTVRGYLEQGNLKVYCDEEVTFYSNNDSYVTFGLDAVLGVIFLLIGLVLFYNGNGQTQLIIATIVIIISWVIGFLNLPFVAVSSVLGLLLFIVFIGRYSRKR